jgi:hypothetical protein
MGPFWNSLLRFTIGKLAVLSKVGIDDTLNVRHLPSAATTWHGHHESARQSHAMYRLPDERTVFGLKFA